MRHRHGEERREVTFKAFVSSCALLASLILAAPAVAQELSGGVAAPAASVAPAPDADPAQDDAPITPEGEEQPPEEQPDGDQTPSRPGRV